MSLETYSGLKASIANWLNRTDLVNEIPDFIQLVENRIAHEVRIPSIEKTAYVIPDTTGYATIPNDFLEMKDVFYNGKPLNRITLTLLKSQTAQSGIPTSFAREANEFVFFPTPTMSATDKLQVTYYYEVEPLTDVAPTNDLLKTVPELYLYGALSEAARFLNTDDTRWEMGYQTAFSRVMTHTRTAETAGAANYVSSGY
jgi:hypothetical protein|tara:strand:- start:269 stop:868 length:600 start_codon:yes stop_codon:yes gene_type:complete